MLQLREHFKVYEAEGTVFGSINQKNFKALPQLSIFGELVGYFDTYTERIDGKIEHNTENIGELTSLRDTLLPKLLTGQLRIPETEQILQHESYKHDQENDHDKSNQP
jgi:type I restriction enzyme S subunit